MSYKYRSRYVRNQAKKSRQRFLLSLIFICLILYGTLMWILPNFVGGLSLVSNFFRGDIKKEVANSDDNASLAPPVLTIPFEATNSSEVKIIGYAAPGSQVKIYLDDSLITETKTNSDGNFTSDKISLNLGSNNIYGKTVNDKNEESLPSKQIKILFDNEKPSLEIYEPEDNKIITGGDKKVLVRGKTDQDVEIFINAQRIITNSEGNFQQTIDISEEENSLTIKSQDKAGNFTEVSRKVIYKSS